MTSKTATKKAAVKQAPGVDPVEAARAEVERLNDAELRQGMLYRLKAAELSDVRRERGDAVLDSDDPAGVAREVGKRVSVLIEEQASFADAARRARELRIAAIPAVFTAECDAKEAQATAMEAEAAALEVESNRLREALESFTDWGWVPAQGRVDGQFVAVVERGAPETYRVVDARGPKYTRLRGEAQAFRSRSAQDRNKVAHRAGSAGGDSVEDVVSAVHSDAMRIGPSAADIITFVESALDADRRRSRTSTEDAVSTTEPLRIHLVWANGIIDTAQSRVIRLRAAATPAGEVGQTIDEILGEPVGA